MFTVRRSLLMTAAFATVLSLISARLYATGYKITNLGSVDGYQNVFGYGINAHGQVCGSVRNVTSSQAFSWESSRGITLVDTLFPTANWTTTRAINDAGQIVGESGYHNLDPYVADACVWNWNEFLGHQPVNLGALTGGTYSEARNINVNGTVVGVTGYPNRAAAWQMDLYTLQYLYYPLHDAGYYRSTADHINRDGLIGGYCQYPAATGIPYSQPSGIRRALLWEPTYGGYIRHELPALYTDGVADFYDFCSGLNDNWIAIGGSGNMYGASRYMTPVYWQMGEDNAWQVHVLPNGGQTYVDPIDINAADQIVGYYDLSPNGTLKHALVWEKDMSGSYSVLALPTLQEGDLSMANDINDAGQIVGYSGNHAVTWWKGNGSWRVTDIGIPFGGTSSSADFINEAGQILCSSRDANSLSHVFLAEPNALPNVTDPGPQWVNERETLSIQFSASDPDQGQTLSFYAESLPPGATFDPVTAVFSWTPTEEQGPGEFFAAIHVTDGIDNVSAVFIITVGEVNDPPTLAYVEPQTIGEGETLQIQLTAYDPDTNSQTLIYSVGNNPDGLSVDAATGLISWTPTEAQGPGSYEVAAMVSDDHFTSIVFIPIEVTEVNQPPTLTLPSSTIDVTAGSLVTFTASVTDPDIPENTLAFSLVGAPAGATIDPSTGAFSWTPSAAGTFTFDVKVGDGFAADTKTVTVNVAPPPSSLDVTLNSVVKKGKSILVSLTVRNSGAQAVANVTLGSATYGGVPTTTRVPYSVAKVLKAGASKTLTLTFLESSVEGGSQLLVVQGSCSAGDFYLTQTVTTP